MNNRTLISKLRSGNHDAVSLTFNNIRTKEQFAASLGRTLEADSIDFLAPLNDSILAADLGFNTETIYTMFIPNTYRVFWNITPDRFIRRMHQEYERFWTPARDRKSTRLNSSH